MQIMKNEKWDRRFLELAKHVSTWSKDPSTKVGSVIVDDKRRVIGLGYNGFPRGVTDNEERLNDRPTKYSMVAHAEVNAILNSNQNKENCTLYIWPLFSCNECAKVIIQSCMIIRVVSLYPQLGRWVPAYDVATILFKEARIQVDHLNDPQ